MLCDSDPGCNKSNKWWRPRHQEMERFTWLGQHLSWCDAGSDITYTQSTRASQNKTYLRSGECSSIPCVMIDYHSTLQHQNPNMFIIIKHVWLFEPSHLYTFVSCLQYKSDKWKWNEWCWESHISWGRSGWGPLYIHGRGQSQGGQHQTLMSP